MKNISKTNWDRINSLSDQQIDTSDCPPLTEEFFQSVTLRKPQLAGTLIDPLTNASWYLLSASEYQAIQEILDDEQKQKAIRGVGLRNAGNVIGSEYESI